MRLVEKAYGDEYIKVRGIKEIWTNELSPLFIKNFNNAKVLPTAVAAPNYPIKSQKYPFLFQEKQWRKLVFLSAYFHSIDCNNFIPKYENLIKNPEKEIRKLCKFLEIDFDINLIDPSNFIDGSGKKWIQNTSYKRFAEKFNIKSIEKWSFVLNQD